MRALVALAALTLSGSAFAHDSDEPHSHDEPPGEAPPAPVTEQVEVAPSESEDKYPPPENTQASKTRDTTAPTTAYSESGPRRLGRGDWRQRIDTYREKKGSEWFEPAHFVFEIRFAPYFPQVDEEFEGTGSAPFAQFFGDEALFYFGLEVDWLPLCIPYVASIGPGYGFGFTSASGNAIVEETGQPAESETSLDIFPMWAGAVVRFDGPLRKLRIPVVPHVKVGFGFGLWSADGPDGTSQADGVDGEGTSLGLHLALGGSVALNAFDPSSAMAMKEATGIRYAYLWGEWMYANLDGIGSTQQMHVGTSTGVVGLALDF